MALADWRKVFQPSPLDALAGYSDEPAAFVRHNHVSLLQDGREAYPAMLDAIAGAKRSVNLETYILRDDRTGRRFADALTERSRSGVDVRLIFDSVGSLGLPDRFVQRLRNGGVKMLEYRPVAPWRRRWGWSSRDHRKILVVDGRVAFTGGLNIADEYADPADGGGGWRDTHARIEGPGAYMLERLFRTVWFRETGRFFPFAGDLRPGPGDSLVRVAANEELLKRFLIRRGYLHAIARAERRILISSAYFIPDRSVRRALYAARRRGVDLRVLVPSVSDVPAVAYASRYLYARHMAKGVRLFAWPGPVLHAKTMAVDSVWAAVGSYNFTHRSLHHNLEVTVHVVDGAFCAQLEESIEADMRASAELKSADWARRPASERMLERLFYLLRYWF